MACVLNLFKLQAVSPGSLQEVTQTMDESVLLQPCDVSLALAQLHTLLSHPLHQHLFCLFTIKTVLNLNKTSIFGL